MVFEVNDKFVVKTLRPTASASHKGDNGRVGVVGGSRLFFGAPALVGFGVLRAGADLVYLVVPDYISRVVASYSPDFIVRDFKGEFFNDAGLRVALDLASCVDCFVVGNGLSKDEGVFEVLPKLFKKLDCPIIMDADALQQARINGAGNVVLTPHAGEFKRLTGLLPSNEREERCAQVEKAAKKFGCTILLKGPTDVISDGARTAFCSTGNAGMTVGGTGDVLAGVLATLIAQQHSLFDSACLAAFFNGVAGGLAFEKFGYSLLATDVADNIPFAFKKYKK